METLEVLPTQLQFTTESSLPQALRQYPVTKRETQTCLKIKKN